MNQRKVWTHQANIRPYQPVDTGSSTYRMSEAAAIERTGADRMSSCGPRVEHKKENGITCMFDCVLQYAQRNSSASLSSLRPVTTEGYLLQVSARVCRTW